MSIYIHSSAIPLVNILSNSLELDKKPQLVKVKVIWGLALNPN